MLDNNEYNKLIGRKLQELREAHKLSREELGEILSAFSKKEDGALTYNTIKKYEQGERGIKIDMLVYLCEHFKVNLYYFLSEKKNVVLEAVGKNDIHLKLNEKQRSILLNLYEYVISGDENDLEIIKRVINFNKSLTSFIKNIKD